MGRLTDIGWAHSTFNPVWGCWEISPGCNNCYAKTWDHRLGGDHWGKNKPYRTFGEKHWAEPISWNRAAQKAREMRRVFCASMCDIFDEFWPDGQREKLWDLISRTPWLWWMLLTKRIDKAEQLFPKSWLKQMPPNVWMGVTIEDVKRRDQRAPELLKWAGRVPVLFVSMEPLLEDVPMAEFLGPQRINWLITGGESDKGARPYDIAWPRRLIGEARDAGIAPFVKQLGSNPTRHGLIQLRLKHKKGEDQTEWPPELRVQEFPNVPSPHMELQHGLL